MIALFRGLLWGSISGTVAGLDLDLTWYVWLKCLIFFSSYLVIFYILAFSKNRLQVIFTTSCKAVIWSDNRKENLTVNFSIQNNFLLKVVVEDAILTLTIDVHNHT